MHDKLTENDIRRLEEEIEYRKLVVRKDAIEAVKEARAHLYKESEAQGGHRLLSVKSSMPYNV